jgi:hypothetical protein
MIALNPRTMLQQETKGTKNPDFVAFVSFGEKRLEVSKSESVQSAQSVVKR